MEKPRETQRERLENAFPPSLPRIIEESTVLATDVVCFCFPLETYHILLSSITLYYPSKWYLNNIVSGKTKMNLMSVKGEKRI